MRSRTLKVTLIVIALLVGAAFASGHDDHPCTGEDHECTDSESGCTCDPKCEDCTCDSLSRAEETSAPIEDARDHGCRGCSGHGCH
jgi:hypothetical protein